MEGLGQRANPGGHTFFHLHFQQAQVQVRGTLTKKGGEQRPTHVQPPLCWPLTTVTHTCCGCHHRAFLFIIFVSPGSDIAVKWRECVRSDFPRTDGKRQALMEVATSCLDAHTSHQRLMPLLHWPCLLLQEASTV